VLPKIQALVEASLLPFPAEHSVVLCADAATQYALDSLAAFGLTKIKIIGPAERLAVRGIRTVSPIAPTGNYRPHIMRGLRDRFATIRSTPPAAKKRIFISRSQAPRRKIQNESQLASILHDFGIDSVHLENLTFNQQVQLMQNAELVIGLHGAGLSNMVWMPSQSHILEIRFRGDASNNCYFSLASATDLQYWYLLADKTRNEDDTHDADAIVDPDRFRSVLAQIIAGLPA
jgi:capsular polysaccharide biosynthesis protein